MSHSFPGMEQDILEFWKTQDVFNKSLERTKDGEPFVFRSQPATPAYLPNYNHLVDSLISDVIPRYQTMLGRYVGRRWGWDCHNPVVGYQSNQEGTEASETALQRVEDWKHIIARFGQWVDFDKLHQTADAEHIELVWQAFSQLWEKDLIQYRKKVSPYSTELGTNLSEVEAQTNSMRVRENTANVLFRFAEKYEGFIAAHTTKPWTLPANLGLCVNPDAWYVQVMDRSIGAKVFISEKTLRYARERHRLRAAPGRHIIVYARVKGSELVGLRYQPALTDLTLNHPNAYRIHGDTNLDNYRDTGVKHLAPSFDAAAHRIMEDVGGPTELCHVDSYGVINGISWLDGLKPIQASYRVSTRLSELGLLWYQDALRHSVPHCPYSDTPLINKCVAGWYLKTSSLIEGLTRNKSEITWAPSDNGRARFEALLESTEDWCISQNRSWGVPVPIWINSDSGKRYCISSLQELADLAGVDVDDLHQIDDITFSLPDEEGIYHRVGEVFNTAFENGVSAPSDMVATDLDQVSGWLYALHVLSTALQDKPAYKQVVTRGYILGSDAKRMTAARGNYTSPEKLIQKHGADALRLYLLTTTVTMGDQAPFYDSGPKIAIQSVLDPWRNAVKFFKTYADRDGWRAGEAFPGSDNPLDVWILAEVNKLAANVAEALDDNKLPNITEGIYTFTDKLTNWYIRINRERFQTEGLSEDKQCAFAVLHRVLLTFAKIMAPLTPFSAEHFYQELGVYAALEQESVHLCEWPKPADPLSGKHQGYINQIQLLQEIVELAENQRDEHDVNPKQPLKAITLIHYDKIDDLSAIEDYVKSLTNVKLVNHVLEGHQINKHYTPNYDAIHEDIPEDYIYAACNALKYIDRVHLRKLQREGFMDIGDGIKVQLKHLLTIRQPRTSEVKVGENIAVMLNTRISSALRHEYLSQIVVSQIHKRRKKKEFSPEDRVVIHYCASSKLTAAIANNADYIAKETCSELKNYDKLSELKAAQGAGAVVDPVSIDDAVIYIAMEKAQ